MSSRDSKGNWVVPADQIEEFMTKPINYKELIKNCLQTKIVIDETIVPKKRKDKKQSIWTREITF